ncbi:transmembrane and coiled-coil domain-containing protein 4-like [Gordionus sp. m RMFG-2023]|uniref:transmembrane and coiled-coil domain-containing protein 4-like n=1 Tax=Gordionus sp. m RMFG-2023 TaxID=3053472 RepID=UPI0031FE328F
MINLINQIPQQEKGVFKSNKMKKYCKIAGATIIGGTLLGVTGGLIAPFLAASSGIILGSAGATLLGTTAGVSIIGSLFGLTGATLTGYKMKQRAGALEEFRFERIGTNSNRKRSTLAITVAVSGWVSKDCDFATPWRDLRITREAYTLRWDGRHLQRFGHGMDYLVSWAASTVVQEILQETVLAALMASVSWPLTLVSLAGVIDNPWGVCFTRAREAGLELANVLITGVAGRRPVTLIGFSLGARVIYHALEFLCQLLSPPKGTKSTAMARGGSAKSVGGRCIDSQLKPCSSEGSLLQIFSPKRHLVPDAKKYTDHIYLLEPRSDKNNLTPNKSSDNLNLNDSYSNNLATADTDLCLKGKDPRGVIADVILMGAPIPSHDDSTYGAWMDVVGGTVTNCYCTKDWILSFLYRTSSAQISIAGLEPLTLTLEGQQHPRLINVNLTSVVTGHNDYVGKMPDILKTLGYHAISYQD